MTLRLMLLLSFAVLLAFVEPARAEDTTQTTLKDGYFVAPGGDDAWPGTRERPWRTIQHAADKLAPGQTAYVRAGTYDEEVVVRNGGANGAPISVENYPGERPVIDSGFKRQCGIRVTGSWFRFEGFEIRNCKADRTRRYAMGGILVAGAGPDRRGGHCVVAELGDLEAGPRTARAPVCRIPWAVERRDLAPAGRGCCPKGQAAAGERLRQADPIGGDPDLRGRVAQPVHCAEREKPAARRPIS